MTASGGSVLFRTLPPFTLFRSNKEIKEYNQSHERQIDKHVVEKCMLSDKVFKYHHGNRWIINYDELEPVIDEFLDKKVGIN